MTEVADDGSMCGDGVVYAMQGEEPVCCTITIHQLEFVDYAEGAGAVFFFFYAILESFAALFVWGENATLDDDGQQLCANPMGHQSQLLHLGLSGDDSNCVALF